MFGIILLIYSVSGFSQEKLLSDNSPEDKPVSASSNSEMEDFFKAQVQYNKQAMDSYPEAKKRYLHGLPKGQHFFLTTRLRDGAGHVEQVFVLVNSITDNVVSGIIYNDIHTVSGYKNGQKYEFSENDIYDWLITKPDGSEEGNFVGKFLDSLQGK